MTADAINLAVRDLVRAVMGMPNGSVRPADQMAPAGGQATEIATVKIVSTSEIGHAALTQADAGDDTSTASVDQLDEVVASVQFYRSPAKDAAGKATYSNAAFDRAKRLGARLQLPSSVTLMNDAGLGLLRVGPARNLAALADSIWESRGQIDLTFNVSTIETEAVVTVTDVPVGIVFQPPGKAPLPPLSTEVTT